MRYVKLFAVALPIALILDMAWIVIFGQDFYRSQIGFLLSESVNWSAAIVFYIFFMIALIVFVIEPALKVHSLAKATVLGAFLGFSMYMTYDLTSLATTRDWPLAITLVDIVWGSLLSMIISVVTYTVATKIFKY